MTTGTLQDMRLLRRNRQTARDEQERIEDEWLAAQKRLNVAPGDEGVDLEIELLEP